MAVTLKDIAEKVQMSQTSVSFVLNDRPNRISPEKRELILKTAKEMNYVPNQNAVGLVKRKSHMIGVIIPDISNAFFSEIVSGIDSTVREHGWNTMIMTTNDDYEKDLTSIRTLAGRSVVIFTLCRLVSSAKSVKCPSGRRSRYTSRKMP